MTTAALNSSEPASPRWFSQTSGGYELSGMPPLSLTLSKPLHRTDPQRGEIPRLIKGKTFDLRATKKFFRDSGKRLKPVWQLSFFNPSIRRVKILYFDSDVAAFEFYDSIKAHYLPDRAGFLSRLDSFV